MNMAQSRRPLPANRAFVVQFVAQPGGERPCCSGRVEHLASGQATRFASQEELWAFISRILAEVSG